MDIKTRLTRCCGRESEYGQICRDGYRCPDCFDKLEGWREIERLRDALSETLAVARRNEIGDYIQRAEAALQQKDSES